MQHGHVVDRPGFPWVHAHHAQCIHHDTIALEHRGVVAIVQGHVIQQIRQLREFGRGGRVDDGVHLSRSEAATQLDFVVRHVAAVVVGLHGVFAEVSGRGRTRVVDLQALRKAGPVHVLREEEVGAQTAGIASEDGHLKGLPGQGTAGVGHDTVNRRPKHDGCRIQGAEVAVSEHLVIAQAEGLEVVRGCRSRIQQVALRIRDEEGVVGFWTLAEVTEVHQGVGIGQAPHGLVGTGRRGHLSPIAARRQTIDAFHLDRNGTEGHTARRRDGVVRSPCSNAGWIEITVIAHAPHQAGARGRAGKVIAEVALAAGDHVDDLPIEVSHHQTIGAFEGVGGRRERQEASRQIHAHRGHTVDGALCCEGAAIAIEEVGVARGRLLQHHLVRRKGGTAIGQTGPSQRTADFGAEEPLVQLGLTRREAVDQKGVGLVRRSIDHGVEQADGGEGRSHREIRTVPDEKGHGISPIAEEPGFIHHARRLNLGVAQDEEARAVQLVAIEVKGGIHRGSKGAAPAFVEHRNVAVQQLIRGAEKLHELEAVRHGLAVGIDLVDEDVLRRNDEASAHPGHEHAERRTVGLGY